MRPLPSPFESPRHRLPAGQRIAGHAPRGLLLLVEDGGALVQAPPDAALPPGSAAPPLRLAAGQVLALPAAGWLQVQALAAEGPLHLHCIAPAPAGWRAWLLRRLRGSSPAWRAPARAAG